MSADDEQSRVEAEAGRANAKLSYTKISALIALPVALVALIPTTVVVIMLDREIQNRCVDGQINREAIRGSITRSLSTIGYAYDPDTNEIVKSDKPPLHYYLEHPDERAQQLENVKASLNDFPPIHC